MPTPSDNLKQLLATLEICSSADLLACEPVVRRLSHDLPDFDSVWLDALVQRRTITPWQAGILQSETPRALRVDRFVLCEPMGTHTYLARHQKSNLQVVLRKLTSETAHRTIQQTIHQLKSETVPSQLALPREVVSSDQGTFVVSEFVAGYAADELLIRGGRIPWPVVAEIGRQLLSAMYWLEQHGVLHGDLTLSSVRVNSDGDAILVNTLTRAAEYPHVTYSDQLTLRDVAATAPECVSTANSRDGRSELYCAGRLLWQLLTARPPFLSADPVNQAVSCKEQDVADVRSVVPDCPEWLAALLKQMTRRNPDLRPASIEEAWQVWTHEVAVSRQATKRMIKRLPERSGSSRNSPRSSRNRLWPLVASVLMLSAFSGYAVMRGLVPLPLTVTGVAPPDTPPAQITEKRHNDSPVETGEDGLAQMPTPDAAGVVVLQSGVTYRAEPLSFAGVMYIESSTDRPARVMVTAGQAWTINAHQLSITGVVIESETQDSASAQPPAESLVDCECGILTLQKCRFQSVDKACVTWNPADYTVSMISVTDCVFSGNGYGLRLDGIPQKLELRNVLCLTSTACLRCDSEFGKLEFVLDRVTQRNGIAFLDYRITKANSRSHMVRIIGGESVLAPETAIVRIAGPLHWDQKKCDVEFLLPQRGNPIIVTPELDPVVSMDRSLNRLVALPANQIVARSLLLADPEFSADSTTAGDSQHVLVDYAGPKLNTQMPGVDIAALPKVFEAKERSADESDVPTTGR